MDRHHWLRPRSILVFSFLLFSLWLLLVFSLRTPYVIATETDALAMIDVLFPYYWIILSAFAFLCFFVFTAKNFPRWLHIVLLSEFALILFYTPFLVGGFSWSPDNLWHAGVAKYFPSIITGSKFSLTQYCETYPFSFGLTYYAESALQIDTITYSLYIFPPVCITLFSSLAYVFISRLTTTKTAFLSMLIALPTLHYIEPHVSPFATGTLLVLLALILLTYKHPIAYVINLLVITALVMTHPISPLFLGMYMVAFLAITLFEKFPQHISTKLFKIPKSTWPLFTILLFFLAFFWICWTMYEAAPNYAGVETPVENILNLSFIRKLVNAVEWTAGGQGFIYPQISQLSLAIYAIFLVSVFIFFFFNIIKLLRKKSMTNLDYLRLRLSITALGSAVISYLLFSSSGERFLLGRGLIFLLLFSSMVLASYLTNRINVNKKNRILTPIAFAFVLFLLFSYPIIAYSKEAYNTFTVPAQEGLNFLSTLELQNKTISMGYDQQLASYTDLSKGLNLTGFPPKLAVEKPDIIVLRINSYYLLSMRYDMSFSNNTYTQLCDYLNSNHSEYTLIFSNAQFVVYEKANNSSLNLSNR